MEKVMEWGLFLSALGIGLAIAAPVGPIGLLVIERSLRRGFAAGLATGLGAAVADALYGAVGAFGVTALVSLLQAARVPMVLGGSAFLLWLAWRTLRAPTVSAGVSPARERPEPRGSLWVAFGSSVLLTLANPATVLSFAAIFGTLAGAVPAGAGVAKAVWMVAGVFCGSALWWLLLAGGVARLRHRLGAEVRRRVAWASALLLAGFALLQLARLGVPR